jgi:oxygen-dependent protoporphyrinogen oxidase
MLATPAFVRGALLRPLTPAAADLLDGIRYVSTGTISLAYPQRRRAEPAQGLRPGDPDERAATDQRHHAQFGQVRSPRAGGSSAAARLLWRLAQPAVDGTGRRELFATVRRELDALLGIRAEPLFHRIYRWRAPTRSTTSATWSASPPSSAALPPGIHVTGSAYRGVGIPDCVKSAQEAAARVTRDLLQVGAAEL